MRAFNIRTWKNICEALHDKTAVPAENRGGGFMWAQNRINLSYDKLYAKINLTYDKRKDIMILR